MGAPIAWQPRGKIADVTGREICLPILTPDEARTYYLGTDPSCLQAVAKRRGMHHPPANALNSVLSGQGSSLEAGRRAPSSAASISPPLC